MQDGFLLWAMYRENHLCGERMMNGRQVGATRSVILLGLALAALVGCGDATRSVEPSGPFACSIPEDLIFSGGPGKDGIPALTNPRLVGAGDPGTEYLRDDDRVIGLFLDGQAVAVPHNIGWWHEIVNFDAGDQRIAVTFCPLTGSSLAFDRKAVGGAELGVSGLLYLSNLIMYDRNTEESLWPQMLTAAACGPRDGTRLDMVPVAEMTWSGWRTLHPTTRVIADDPRRNRNYRFYPYDDYDRPNNGWLISPVPTIDPRRPPKERVLGIPGGGGGGVVFPFGSLDEIGAVAAVTATTVAGPVVVFWDRSRQAAVAHFPRAGDQHLSFEVRGDALVDVETQSVWTVDGLAVSGPLKNERLAMVPEAFVSFWFAWASFNPYAIVWAPVRG